MTKQEARIQTRHKLALMTDDEKEWASGAIADAVSGLYEFCHAHKIFIYLGTSGEPDTHEIVGLALMLEKDVCVPRVKGEDMQAVMISPYTNFKTNKWGILEPVGGHTIDDIDVAIIPLMAFDGLNRVGHGKGYYDRYLASHDCIKIGLAFDCQRVDNLEIEAHDIGLDLLVTEKVIIDMDGERKNVYGEKNEGSCRQV